MSKWNASTGDDWYKRIMEDSDALKRENKQRRANKLKHKKRDKRGAIPPRGLEGKVYNGQMGTWVDEEK